MVRCIPVRSRSESFRVDPWVDESTHDKRSVLALPLLESPLHYSKQLRITDLRIALTRVDSTTRLHPHGVGRTHLSHPRELPEWVLHDGHRLGEEEGGGWGGERIAHGGVHEMVGRLKKSCEAWMP